ncbi:unnamed protein product [Gordionus sp. m RMFG-2023]|uniref:D(2) dopamine receptor-like n=1 Tax=Gordionus sp. m RMFG-2023 TaxID=3053472 RepID=UPI0030DFADF1
MVGATVVFGFSLFLGIVTMIGNGCIMILFLRHKSIRVTRNYIIFSLALADFLIGLFAMPLAANQNHISYWNFSVSLCYFHVIIDTLATLVSIFTVTLTALLDIGLVFGKGIRNVYSCRNVSIVIALSWLAPGLTILLPIAINPSQMGLFIKEEVRTHSLFFGSVQINSTTFHCLPDFPKVLFASLVVFYYIFGLSLTVAAYAAIFIKIRLRKRFVLRIGSRAVNALSPHPPFNNLVHPKVTKIPTDTPTLTVKQTVRANALTKWKRNEGLLRMMFAIGTLAFVCYLPGSIVFLLEALADKGIALWAFKLGIWLSYAKSAINPILYGFLNHKFKKYICKCFGTRVENATTTIGSILEE